MSWKSELRGINRVIKWRRGDWVRRGNAGREEEQRERRGMEGIKGTGRQADTYDQLYIRSVEVQSEPHPSAKER